MDPKLLVKQAIPAALPVKMSTIIPVIKEGGAFVKVSHEKDVNMEGIESKLREHLKEHPVKPMFSPWSRLRAALVKGRPWIEDLHRFPTQRLRIEFLPPQTGAPASELTEEQLYTVFRKFGKILNIVPPPSDPKVAPRFANVTFKLSRQAIMAKNCIHGFRIPEAAGGGKDGTLLRINYERIVKAHWIRDWFTNHPRIVIPLVAALVAAITVAIFDPIRTWFIKFHVCHFFDLSDRTLYKWFRSQISRANDIFSFRTRRIENDSFGEIWDDRKDTIEQLKTWLMENTDTFIVVQGPRGSGKRELVVDEALKNRENTLVIDCKPIQEASSDSAKILAAAKEVGYRPVFSWMNSVSSLVDLAAQGTIGTKTGFTETLDAQLAKILQNTATALRQIALEHKYKDEHNRKLGDNEYLESHPERRPVVVIENYLHRGNENTLVYDKIAEWAAGVTNANVAHVIFMTHDVSYSKSLSKAMPDRVFRQVSLGDCSPEVAKRFVLRHLDVATRAKLGLQADESPADLSDYSSELDAVIEVIGGRLQDLEFLARRLKTGERPHKAGQEIIAQSASEILKMYILDRARAARSGGWTPQQAWTLITALAARDEVPYNDVLLADTWKGSDGDAMLSTLEQAELIAIASESNGRPRAVRPGRPVFRAAFQHLTRDRVLAARLEMDILNDQVKAETAGIDKAEAELKLLGELPKQPGELGPRIRYLLKKVQAGQQKVESYEARTGELKKVLQEEF